MAPVACTLCYMSRNRFVITSKLGAGIRALEDLVWPRQCAGCGRWDVDLCDECVREVLTGSVDELLEDAQGIPSWPLVALGEYEGRLRDILLTAKHDSGRDMSQSLLLVGRRLGELCFPTVTSLPRGALLRVWIVPAPSSHERRRRRAEIVPAVAQVAASSLSEALANGGVGGRRPTPPSPLPIRVVAAVELSRQAGGMAGKSARKRGVGRAGSMRLVRPPPKGTAVIILDDVSTTGATLREMVRLLDPAVILCAVVAVAP